MRRLRLPALIGATLLMEALCGTALAQTAKLSGRITDAADGSGLPGATVTLVGTSSGASADVDGRYVVVGVTPGTYEVRFSYIGYATQTVQIRLVSDRTTELNAVLLTQEAEGQEVVVETTRPVVDQNQTTSRSLVTGEEMTQLPVASVQDVISRTANSYEGFVRGSRRYETRTVIEGIDVSDALNQIAPNGSNGAYSGLTYSNTNRSDQTNASLFTLNPEGIEEVTVNTGATESRYGGASGGVVAITLGERRGALTGSLSVRVAPYLRRPGPDSLSFYNDIARYNELRDAALATVPLPARAAYYTFTPGKYDTGGQPEVDTRFSLGGSILPNWTFQTTGQWFQTNGYMPNQYSKRLGGQLKSTYSFNRNTRLTALGIVEDRGLWGGWNNRSYHDFFRYYLEGVAQNDGGSGLGSLRLTHLFSNKTFAELQVYRTYQRTRYGYTDDDGDGFTEVGEDGDFLDFTNPIVADKYIGRLTDNTKMFYENISDITSDVGITARSGQRYKAARPTPYSEDAEQVTNGLRLDVSSQVTRNHYLQGGTEVKLRRFDYQQVAGQDQTGSKLGTALEPFQLSEWTRRPTEVGVYVSDRMEYNGLVVNLGLRTDFVDRNMREIADFFYPFRRDSSIIGVDSAGKMRKVARNAFKRGEKVAVDVFFAPTLGVSHPIGTRASMYFSYARTQQLLPYSTLYQLYDGNNSNNVSVFYQDPNQKPITSNNFELGLQWELFRGLGMDVNAYMRAIDNYGQVAFVANNRTPAGIGTTDPIRLSTYFYNTTAGYADVRGIEMTLRQRPVRLARSVRLGLTGTYTYASVETNSFAGNNRTSFSDLIGDVVGVPFDNANEFKNFPQNVQGGASTLTGGYDRAHRFTLRATSTLPFGVNLGLIGSLESGFLYARVLDVDPRDRELLTGPTNARIDARLEKRFSFARRFGLDLYADVTNLFDRENIVAYESGAPSPFGAALFQSTGDPGDRLVLRDGSTTYGPARTVYFGTRLRF